MDEDELDVALSTIQVNPGDVIVLTSPRYLSRHQSHHIAHQLVERFPGHNCVILDAGARLSALPLEPMFCRLYRLTSTSSCSIPEIVTGQADLDRLRELLGVT